MNSYNIKVLGACLLPVFLVLWMPWSGLIADGVAAEPHKQLLKIGKIGPKAAKVEVSTSTAKRGKPEQKEDTVIRLKSSSKVYFAILFFSSAKKVTLVFPEGAAAENVLLPGKELVLFGSESRLQLEPSKALSDTKLVLYFSSNPLKLDPPLSDGDRPLVSIPYSDVDDLTALMGKLGRMAEKEDLNRVVVHLKPPRKPSLRRGLMGVPKKGTSRKPGTILGTQGVKEKAGKGQKK
ncbi:hypothetical protein ACFL2Q_14880 [Thermodesulfobacteriota bacterium]